MLKPQDIFVMLKLIALGSKPWSYAGLAVELAMSPSQLHAAVKRALAANLAIQKQDQIAPHIRNLKEFLVYGLKYVFVAKRGELTRGIPTSYAAPPLNTMIAASSSELPPVWPYPQGEVRGEAFSPLCKHVPQAAQSDEKLYELLALVDAIRDGRARERKIAIKELEKRLGNYV